MGYKGDAIVDSIRRGQDAMFLMREASDALDDLIGLRREVVKTDDFNDEFLTKFNEHIEFLEGDISHIMYNASYDAMANCDAAIYSAKKLEE